MNQMLMAQTNCQQMSKPLLKCYMKTVALKLVLVEKINLNVNASHGSPQIYKVYGNASAVLLTSMAEIQTHIVHEMTTTLPGDSMFCDSCIMLKFTFSVSGFF